MISIITKLDSPPLGTDFTSNPQSRLDQNQRSFASFVGAKLCNSVSVATRKLRKRAFKIQTKRMLFSTFEAEEDYVEASISFRSVLANYLG